MGLDLMPTPLEMPDADLIKKYLELRVFKAKLEEKHETELAPYKQGMELIQNIMLNRLNERGSKNSATPEGTAYKSETVRSKVSDRTNFIAFIMEQWDQWGDMMLVSAQADAVKRWIEHYKPENDKAPIPPIPGVELEFRVNCNIRRS